MAFVVFSCFCFVLKGVDFFVVNLVDISFRVKLLSNKIIVTVSVSYYAKFLLDRFNAVALEHFVFSAIHFSILTDFNCSHPKMKLVAYIKGIVSG